MASDAAEPAIDPAPENARSITRKRDAAHTRRSLLQAARLRFARDGYAATTVRDIAADAGVNVALINRYFGSKEGLFEACIVKVGEGFERRDQRVESLSEVLREVVRQATGSNSGEQALQLQLLLLLRSSGDSDAERIRQRIYRSFAERLATAAGWTPGDAGTEHLMLRAQLATSTLFGTVLLRASSGLEPLASATEEELTVPLIEVLTAMLSP